MVDQSPISEERDGRGQPWPAGMSRACGGGGGAWRRISRALLLPLEFATKREAVGIKPAASFNYVCPLLSSVTCDLLLCIVINSRLINFSQQSCLLRQTKNYRSMIPCFMQLAVLCTDTGKESVGVHVVYIKVYV
jgi:hypothetical protein